MVLKNKDTNKIALKLLQETSNDIIGKEHEAELIEHALRRNIIICSDDFSLKYFVMIALIKRYSEFGKYMIIIYFDDEEYLNITNTIHRHTNAIFKDLDNIINEGFSQSCIILIKFDYDLLIKFKDILKNTILLIITDCSEIFDSDSNVTSFLQLSKDLITHVHIYGMQSSLLNKITSANRIESKIPELESLLNAHVDIGMVNISRSGQNSLVDEEFLLYNSKNKMCKLEEFVHHKLKSISNFLIDIEPELKSLKDTSLFDYCLKAILKCESVLNDLGVWCCCVVGRAFIRHFIRLMVCRKNKNFSNDSSCYIEDTISWILANCSSELSEIVKICSATFDKMQDIEEFKTVQSPKVARLVELLKRYKSSLNFKIEAIKLPTSSRESKCCYNDSEESIDEDNNQQNFSTSDCEIDEDFEDDELMDTTDDNDDDSNDVATDDESASLDRGGPTFRQKTFMRQKHKRRKKYNKKCHPNSGSTSSIDSIKNSKETSKREIKAIKDNKSNGNVSGSNRFLFRAVIPENSDENFDKLSCLIYVNCSFSAYALSKFLEELCSWDSDLFFVRPGHVFDSSSDNNNSDKTKLLTANQEEILNQFRRNQINVLVTTKIINSLQLKLPSCNLVVRFDEITELMEYFHCKSKVGPVSTNTANLLRRANSSVAEAIVSRNLIGNNMNSRPVKPMKNGFKMIHLIQSNHSEEIKLRINEFRKIESEIQNRYYKLTNTQHFSLEEMGSEEDANEIDKLEEPLTGPNCKSPVTLSKSICLLNLYCARLPTDIFTKLTPDISIESKKESNQKLFRCTLALPINSPYRLTVKGNWMATVRLSKMSSALATLRELYANNELDCNFQPWNKEDDREIPSISDNLERNSIRHSKLSDNEYNELLLGSSKRRSCYNKGAAKCLSSVSMYQNKPCYLYSINIELSRKIPEQQNLKGRKLMISQNESRYFGVLSGSRGLDKTLIFPVFTRSGEEEISINEETFPDSIKDNDPEWLFNEEQFEQIVQFHKIMFLSVFRLKIDKNMTFNLDTAHIKLLLVPLNKDCTSKIDWEFLKHILSTYNHKENICRLPIRRAPNNDFEFKEEDYENAVVMPSYRNMDYRQYYYVADICYNMRPTTNFPGENFSTFAEYYEKKYNARITNYKQPLLDADFSVMRLNMSTPRHVNFKGIALPLPSEAKKKSIRESIHQKQFLIPELCYIHPFPATLWHKAACLPTVIHRVNQLLLAEELRNRINEEVGFCKFGHTSNIRHKLELDYNLDGGIRTENTNSVIDNVKIPVCIEQDDKEKNDKRTEESNENGLVSLKSDADFGVFKADEFLGENEQEYYETNSDVESTDSFDDETPPEFHPINDEKLCSSLNRCDQPGPQIVLEALTMLCAADFINLERMETVGDSFLKYCSTVYNFLKYPTAHEGRLSYLRSYQVSNSNLYQRAKERDIFRYINSQKFTPNDGWILPGWTNNSATGKYIQNNSESNANSCLNTQHFLSDKSLADAVESLVGCYLTTRGEISALRLLKWFNIDCVPIDSKYQSNSDGFCDESQQYWIKPKSPFQIPMVSEQDWKEFHEMTRDLSKLENKIGYTFQEKAYLLQAMTHSSYNENRFTDCYQRLELLGDAVLDYVITRCLYEDCRRHSPGELTDLRSALVNNNIFAALVVKFNIHHYFKCNSPKLWTIIDNFVVFQKDVHKDNLDYIIHHESKQAHDETNDVSNNTEEEVEIPKCLGDIFESLVGAVFIDSDMNLNVVWKVFYPLFKERIERYTSEIPKSPVRKLLELLPEIINFESPKRTADGKTRVCVRVIGKGRFYGVGRNYRIAKSVAAKKALKTLLRDDPSLSEC